MSGARGIPVEWLDGTPFSDYFAPSLILFVIVGGVLAVAALAVLRGSSIARPISLAAGIILLGWIAVQVSIIGYVSWMQPAVVGASLVILVLAMLPTPQIR